MGRRLGRWPDKPVPVDPTVVRRFGGGGPKRGVGLGAGKNQQMSVIGIYDPYFAEIQRPARYSIAS